MEVEEAIRTRRTHKAYRPEPVDRELLEEILELARWAPNHNLTNPWRFRVIGPRALERLKEAAGPESASKLDRAPTLVVCSCALTGDPIQDEEDLHATACAAYIVLLAAHGRGLAAYWRTPEVLRTPDGRAAVGIPEDERFVGLLHLGTPVQEQRPPERLPADQVDRVPGVTPMISRNDALQALQEHAFDVVVIGGGITGAGVALDAASRGYSVALLERDDFGGARRAAPRRWSTAACATCRTSTSGWSARPCSSASCWSSSPRTSSTRPRSWCRRSARAAATGASGSD